MSSRTNISGWLAAGCHIFCKKGEESGHSIIMQEKRVEKSSEPHEETLKWLREGPLD